MWYVIPTPPFAPGGVERGSSMNREYALRDPPPKDLEGFQAARFDALSVADPVGELQRLFDIFILLQGLP